MSLKRALALGSMLVLAAPAAQAATTYLYYNFDEFYDTTYFAATPDGGGNGPLAQQFATGGSAVSLWNLNLPLSSDSMNDGGVVVTLHADSGNTPGSVLAILGTVTNSAANNPTPFLGITYALTAATSYWIMVTDPYDVECQNDCDTSMPTSIQWDVTSSLTDMTNGTTPGAYNTMSDDFVWEPGDPGPYIMSIDYLQAPEPAMLLVLGAGLLGLGIANRRGRRRG